MRNTSLAKLDGLIELSAAVRASDRFGGGRRLLTLIALGVLAQQSSQARANWKELRNVTAHGLGADFQREMLSKLAEKVEAAHPLLEGVFAQGLIEDLLQASGELPGLALVAYQVVETLEEGSASEFGAWFDTALDETSVGHYGETTTPRPIAELMADLAKIEQGQTVLDPCCGVGSLLSRAGQSAPSLRLFGQDLNVAAAALSRLRLYFLDLSISVKVGDALKAPALWPEVNSFDRVLCDPPYGQASGSFEEGLLRQRFPEAPLRLENLFLEHCLDQLAPGGRAVVLVPYGFLFRKGRDAKYRESLLRRGYIEGIIGLPGGVMPYSEAAFALIVLNGEARSEASITFVDAAFLKPQGRKSAERLTKDQVRAIASLYFQGGSPDQYAKISSSLVFGQDADLQPRRFLIQESIERQDVEELVGVIGAAEAEAADAKREFESRLEAVLRNLRPAY